MSTDTPITAALDCPEPKYAQEIQFDGARYFVVSPEDYEELYESHQKLERENARLREELAEAKDAIQKWMGQCAEWRDANIQLGQRAEQSEGRALEYKTEHAALLGTSQWQEVEIADLRDDVKRHMKIASECEERALAVEKDAGRYRWLRSNESVYSEDMKAPWPVVWADPEHLNNGTCPCLYEELDSAIDAAMGAKHDSNT